jgi:hypothetical protein
VRYETQWLPPRERAEKRAQAIRAKLCVNSRDGTVARPPRMRQRTFEQLLDQLERFERAAAGPPPIPEPRRPGLSDRDTQLPLLEEYVDMQGSEREEEDDTYLPPRSCAGEPFDLWGELNVDAAVASSDSEPFDVWGAGDNEPTAFP